jgi:hypothetical protein
MLFPLTEVNKMKIIFHRTSNDQLVSESGARTVEEFEVEPENFNNEMVGWEYQDATFDKENNTLKIILWDKSEPEDYL